MVPAGVGETVIVLPDTFVTYVPAAIIAFEALTSWPLEIPAAEATVKVAVRLVTVVAV